MLFLLFLIVIIFRFGHPSDAKVVFSGETIALMDYILGLLAIPVILCILFLFWNVLFFMFKCLGWGNILRGTPPTSMGGSTKKKIICYRIAVLLSTFLIIILASISLCKIDETMIHAFDGAYKSIDVS